MAIYKIKRFSVFTKLDIEELKKSLPSEYLLLQRMSLDPTLKSLSNKATYLKNEGEFPSFKMIPLENNRKDIYQEDWRLPIFQVDSMGTPVYYNFKKGVWENFQGREITDLKTYLWNLWNDSYLDWEKGEFDDYLHSSNENVYFQEYTKALIKSAKRYL